MPTPGGQPEPQVPAAKALAFYLPQYHPIPENDGWWGKGFTEWVNVSKARPLFPGHYQPHVPGELGYYDLRVPEVREAQAELARDHGISGFVYYHYWFNGKQLLERPFEEVLASGRPDFPFALCWANEEWTRNWDAQTGQVLMPQEYSDKDDLDHIRWLAQAFADPRYIKIDGRPLMLIYRPALLPDPKRTTDLWRSEAQKLGFPDLYLAWVESHGPPPGGPKVFGLDATVAFMPPAKERLFTPLDSVRGHRILDYVSSFKAQLEKAPPKWKQFPSVMVGWDNTARRPRSATIYEGATPEKYQKWLEETVASMADVREEERYLFILAWNEWAEGNHLEPDQRFGREFLEATQSVLVDSTRTDKRLSAPSTTPATGGDDDRKFDPSVEYSYPFDHDSSIANAAGLVRALNIEPTKLLIDLGAGTGVVAKAFRHDRIAYHGLEIYPESVAIMKAAGIASTQCDITDFDALTKVLEEIDDVGAFLMLDVIEHLSQPHQLLSALSAWALKRGEPSLVVSVPNVAHFDLGMSLLCGEWAPTKRGLLDSTHLRFFVESTLERMFERCGWKVIARDDFYAIHSDKYDRTLVDNLPEELVGALSVLAQTYNPHWATQQFVWALTPVAVDKPPESFYEAVGSTPEPSDPVIALQQRKDMYNYLSSVGIVASETNRRAVALRLTPPRWRRGLIRAVTSNPRTASAYRWLSRRLG
jgi:hypothetical protein